MTITVDGTSITPDSSYLSLTSHFDALENIDAQGAQGNWYVCTLPLTNGSVITSKGKGGSGTNLLGIFM